MKKKVIMMRTKGQIRCAKSKGRQFERDCEASLKQTFPDTYMTHEKGYITQYDLKNDTMKDVFECKRHKSISWNQAKKWFEKLKSVAPEGYMSHLIFQSNQQPVLVMAQHPNDNEVIQVVEFQDAYGVPFIKHEPVRRKKIGTEQKETN